jgi:hypothetical protein
MATKQKAANPTPYAAKMLLNRDTRADIRQQLATRAAAAAANKAQQQRKQAAAAAALQTGTAAKTKDQQDAATRAAANEPQLRAAIANVLERVTASSKHGLKAACVRMLQRYNANSVPKTDLFANAIECLRDPETTYPAAALRKLANEPVISTEVSEEIARTKEPTP